MDNINQQEKINQLYRVMLVVGIIVVAFNLRPAITSIGPLIGIIRDDMGLANWSVALLTSLPLVAFAVMSPLIPKLAHRYTNERVLILGLLTLGIGIGIRSISSVLLIFVGTFLIGIGIAICNVLLPGIIKGKFPTKVGVMTSVYTTVMGIFAATASGLSVPLAEGLNLGWQIALLIWALPALVGLFIWTYLLKRSEPEEDELDIQNVHTENKHNIWRSPLAWQVAFFMGLQSFLFYVTISWLPEILHHNGVSMTTAGWLLFFTQMIGLPASFFVPVMASKYSSQQMIVIVMGLTSFLGFTGLLIGNSYTIMIISIIFIGIALSGMFALALTILSLRARTARQAAELSGMAQSIGYVLAAVGPMLIGYLYDITETWNVPLIGLLIIIICVILFGLGAGRDKYVFD